MRWLVLVLLVANVTFFTWQIRALEPEPSSEPAAALLPATAPGRVNRLLLLSELEGGALRPRSLAAVEDETAPDRVDSPDGARLLQCFGVGPLETPDTTVAVQHWLAERGLEASLREDERREVPLYWVYLPPAESRAAASTTVARLEAEGVQDIYLIPRGDMANAVSLGVYSQRASLERRLRDLRRRGYDPAMAPRHRTTRAAWLDVAVPAGASFDAAALAERFPGIEASEAACPPAAEAPRTEAEAKAEEQDPAQDREPGTEPAGEPEGTHAPAVVSQPAATVDAAPTERGESTGVGGTPDIAEPPRDPGTPAPDPPPVPADPAAEEVAPDTAPEPAAQADSDPTDIPPALRWFIPALDPILVPMPPAPAARSSPSVPGGPEPNALIRAPTHAPEFPKRDGLLPSRRLRTLWGAFRPPASPRRGPHPPA